MAGTILQPMYSQPPAVQTVRGGLMFSVNFVLVPSNLLHLVPSFLTLWLELDNGGPAGLMEGAVMLFPGCCSCGFPDTSVGVMTIILYTVPGRCETDKHCDENSNLMNYQ